MGRHSASDDDTAEAVPGWLLAVDPSRPAPRRHRAEPDPDDEDTQVIAAPEQVAPAATLPVQDVAPEPVPPEHVRPAPETEFPSAIPVSLEAWFDDGDGRAGGAAPEAALHTGPLDTGPLHTGPLHTEPLLDSGPLIDADALAAADELTTAQEAAALAAAKAVRSGPKQQRRESGTQADLRLLRTNRRVRAECLGAIVLTFAVYTAVMLVIGRVGDYSFWVWIPIVVSCVAFGACLDAAHRRAGSG